MSVPELDKAAARTSKVGKFDSDIAQRIDGTAGGRRVRAWARLLGIAGAALAGAAYALLVGQDLNWDLFNYHRYNLHALIVGSFLEDVAPAGLQSFFNPIIYLPHYLLHRSLPPALAGAVLGGIQGLNIVLVWMLAGQLLRGSGGLALQVMATALGVTGAVTLSEIGTSFADVLTSLPVLLALLLILRSSADHSQSRLLSAGLLIGMAVGLKLTNSIYAVGALAAVSVGARPLPRTLRLGTGVALGGLLTGGPWALFLWREYGSPTFPLYNGMFHAPDGPDSNLVEARFLPTDLADALFYPFYALIGDHRTTEVAHRDGRFALLAVLALAALAAHLWRRGEGERQATAPQSQVGRPYASFMLVSYLLWLALFGIQRYAVVLEMLAGLAIVALLDSLLADRRKRLIVAAVVVVSVAAR